MALNRRVDLADREFLSRASRRVLAQAARDAGDGSSASTATVPWGNITGTITNQTDLAAILRDNETLHFLLDD